MNKKSITILGILSLIICSVMLSLFISTQSTTFNVTFDSNGGTTVFNQKIESGGKAIEPKEPTKDGYTFDGWYLDLKNSNSFDFNTSIINDTKLIAKWSKTDEKNNTSTTSEIADDSKLPDETTTDNTTDSEVENSNEDHDDYEDLDNDNDNEKNTNSIPQNTYAYIEDINEKTDNTNNSYGSSSSTSSNSNIFSGNSNVNTGNTNNLPGNSNSNTGNTNKLPGNSNSNTGNTNNLPGNSNENTGNENQPQSPEYPNGDTQNPNNEYNPGNTDVENNTTQYTIKHYKMNIDGTTYAEPEIETKTGTINTSITPEVKQYEGFTSPEVQTININGDGSSVVEYYYTRNKYTVTLTYNEGISEVIGLGEHYYEEEVLISAKLLDGYSFDYWIDDDNNEIKYQENELKIQIGTKNISLTGNAKPNEDTAYTIKHYKMNTDGTTYAEPEIETKTGTTNTFVTPEVKEYEGFTSPEAKTVNIDGTGNTIVEYFYTRNKYKITLEHNEGISEVIGSGEYYYDEEILISAKPLDGYSFDYWINDNEIEYQDPELNIKMGTKDIFLTANAKLNEYTITYDANGGTTETTEQKVLYGGQLTKPNNPTYTGYTFIGWYINLEDEKPFDFNTTMPAGDLILHAKWDINKYNVIFNPNGGQGKMEKQEFTYGQTNNLKANEFTKNGYVFNGWAESEKGPVKYADKAEVKNLVEIGDKTLYAIWSVTTYNITYDLDGGVLETPNPENYTIETESIKLNNPQKEGYRFKEWILSDGTVLADSTINKGTTGNLALKAVYVEDKKVKVIFNANNGTNDTSEQEIHYLDNTKLTPNSFTKSYNITYNYNYSGQENETEKCDNTFLGWATDINGEVVYKNEDIIKEDKNNGEVINLYAKWENPTITLKQPTRSGYGFAGWSTSTDKSGIINTKEYTLTGDITLTAIWSESVRIESVSFDVKDSSGKPYKEAISMGDNAFYLKFPKGSSFDIGSLKLKTNMPISLNVKATEDPNYIDIKPSSVSENGLSGKISINLGLIGYSMDVVSTDKINWSTKGKSRYVGIDTFTSLADAFLGGKSFAIAKGFGINADGLQTPHYISTRTEISGTTYMFFKEEGVPDVTVNYVNESNTLLSITIPKGSPVPNIGTINVVGKNFDNWYTDKDYTTVYDFNKPVYNDITIYGKYNLKDMDTSWYDNNPNASSYDISTVAQLKGFAYLSQKSNNYFSGKTINLINDIDLKNEQWIPIENFWR